MATTPKKPQDHLPAKTDSSVVDYNGTEYTVPNDFFDDLEVVEALEEGQIASVLKDMLGADQWTQLKDQLKAESEDGKARLSKLDGFFQTVTAGIRPTS